MLEDKFFMRVNDGTNKESEAELNVYLIFIQSWLGKGQLMT